MNLKYEPSSDRVVKYQLADGREGVSDGFGGCAKALDIRESHVVHQLQLRSGAQKSGFQGSGTRLRDQASRAQGSGSGIRLPGLKDQAYDTICV